MMETKIDIWLVWSLDTRNCTSLRTICTSRHMALMHKQAIEIDMAEHDWIVRVWIEKSRANHLYGAIAQFDPPGNLSPTASISTDIKNEGENDGIKTGNSYQKN